MGDNIKTITGEQILEVDGVNFTGLGIGCDDDYGTVGEVVVKDANNNISWGDVTIPDNSVTTAKIVDGAVTGAKLANNIAISTTGNIDTTGSGNIQTTGSGNIQVTGTGKVKTNNLAKVSGTEITVEDHITLSANKNITLSGTGAITTQGLISTTGNINCEDLTGNDIIVNGDLSTPTGKIFTNTISRMAASGAINIEHSIIMSPNQAIALEGTGSITLTGSGDLQTSTGKVKTNTIGKTTGSNITIEDDVVLSADKGLVLQGVGAFTAAGSGSIVTSTGDLQTVAGKVLTNTIAKSTGTNITIEDDVVFSTGKGVTTTTGHLSTGSGLIGSTSGEISTGSGNIQTTSGKVYTNTIAKSTGSEITFEDPINCGSNNITTTGQVSANTLSVTTFNPASVSVTGNLETSAGNIVASGAASQITATGLNAAGHFTAVKTNSLEELTAHANIDVYAPLNLQNNDILSTGDIILSGTSSEIKALGTNGTGQFTGVSTNSIQHIGAGTISITSPIDFNTNDITTTGTIHTHEISATGNIITTLGNLAGVNITGTGLVSGQNLNIHSSGLAHTFVAFPNLPTSSAGLLTGQVWNDSGTLKIV